MQKAVRSRRPVGAALLAGLAVLTTWLVAGLSFGTAPASGVTAPAKGYWLGASDGGVFGFGEAPFYGSTGAITLNRPIVGMAATRSGKGYWEVASDGGIFNFGDAGFHGSTGALTLNRPIVGMAATPSGKGYWLVASDGGIFGFGDAGFHGSTGAIVLVQPIVGMAATPSGSGYWMVAADGGIFAFGDARFLGSTGAIRLNMPIVGMAASPTGLGYWLVASDGGIFNFGDARFLGSTGAIRLNRPIVGMAAGPGVPETVVDTTRPGVTVKQAAAQADPTRTAPVSFTVAFSEPVTGFTGADVTIGGTAGGTRSATVTGSGSTYTVSVTGMTTAGTVTVSVAAGVARDAAGNLNTASTSIDNSVTYDATAPTVTVDQAAAQADPGGGSEVSFTVVFSEAVTGFTGADVTVAGTAGGTKTAAVTGSGANYDVAVSGMTSDGTVIASVAAGAATDAAGNASAESTSSDDTVTWDGTAPTVTVNQATGQIDPDNTSPVEFTVTFSEPVTGFTNADVALGGTAGGTKAAAVTGGPTAYDVAVSGMTSDGTVVVSLGAGAATDLAGNPNSASTSTDDTVNWDATAPTVTGITSSTADGAYNAGDVISIQVGLSESVTVTGTPTLALNTGGSASYASGSGTQALTFTYTVAAGENAADLDYTATSALALAGGTIADAVGNDAVLTLPTPGAAGSLGAGKALVVDTTDPVFQSIAATMASTTVTATFSEPIACATVAAADFAATVAGNPVSVTGAACAGAASSTVDLTLASAPLGGATVSVSLVGTVDDPAGNTAATVARNTTATTDVTVTIDQAVAQADPANTSPLAFTVVFSENVSGFTAADITLGGTAGGTLSAAVSGGPLSFDVAVTGMTTSGTVTASIPAGAAADLDGNLSASSTSTDNSVTWDVTGPTVTVNQGGGQADPASTSPVAFTVVFSEPVTGFTDSDVTLTASTAGGTLAGAVTGGPTTYDVAVTGMTTSGSVVVTVASAAAQDAAGNGNAGSTSTDNTVTWDVTAPTVTVNQAGGQADPANTSPVNFTVVFSEAVTGFADGDVTFTGSTAGGTLAAAVTGGPTSFNVAVSGMTTDGTVVASLGAGAASDAAGNTSDASTSTDGTVTWDTTAPTVTVEQKGGQADPDNTSPVEFTVTFSEAVSGFANGDVSFTGSTAGGTLSATVTGGPASFNVAVAGMTTPGDVVASVGAGVAADAAGNGNQASTSTDNSVLWDATAPAVTVEQAAGQADATNASPIHFTVTFDEDVTGFDAGDVTVGGTAGATTAVVSGGPSTYDVAVSGMTGDGSVTASVGAGGASDLAGNTNAASTSSDNMVTYDTQAPSLDHIEVSAGSATVVAVFDEPVLCSSVAVSDFAAAIDGVGVGVSAAGCTGTSDASVEVTLGSPVVEGGTTGLTLNAGAVTDVATNASGGAVTLVASAIALDPGSPADGATLGLLDPATYPVTAVDSDGTIAGIDAMLEGTGVVVSTSCTGIGTGTATCTFDPALVGGPHTLTFTAVDDDGNVTSTTRTVTRSLV